MQNLDSLGVGFTVASHDMDIRGSGNLLGDEQSGHVKETGVELYQQMLLETIEDLKNEILRQAQHDKSMAIPNLSKGDENLDFSIQIKLGISLLIPEEYMPDLSLRMSFYKKIAMIKNDEDARNLVDEMNDRFGKIPEEILNLIEITKLKHLCKTFGIEKFESTSDGLVLGFKNNQFRNPEKLLTMIFASKNKIRLHTGQRVLFVCDTSSTSKKISSAFAVIKKLEEL
jgi:transcription-repair coupling factor (superfamily II helicase)